MHEDFDSGVDIDDRNTITDLGVNFPCNMFFRELRLIVRDRHTRVYPKVSGLAAWSKNCEWYSSLPLDAVISLFCESSLVSFAVITLRVASQRLISKVSYISKLLDTPSYI